eukprot:393446_1
MAETKIAIIGGGLCGVTAAHAIKERLEMLSPDDHSNVQIVIYEADPNSFNEGMKFRKSDFERELQPEWRAATSRNANSLVPGAAMHIMSRRSNLLKMAKDSIRETILCMKLGNILERDFSTVPP